MKFLLLSILSVITLTGCQNKNPHKKEYLFLREVSESINKSCPMRVDSMLRLENTVVFPDLTFRYNYTLWFDTVKYDLREFENGLRRNNLNMVRTSPDGKILRDMNATIVFNYSDSIGNYLFQNVYGPKDYIRY